MSLKIHIVSGAGSVSFRGSGEMGGPFMMVPLETAGLNPWIENSSFLLFYIYLKMQTEPAFEKYHVFWPENMAIVHIFCQQYPS